MTDQIINLESDIYNFLSRLSQLLDEMPGGVYS